MTTAIDVMEAEGEGVFAVNAKILLEPLKELPDQPLTFEIDDNIGNIPLLPERTL